MGLVKSIRERVAARQARKAEAAKAVGIPNGEPTTNEKGIEDESAMKASAQPDQSIVSNQSSPEGSNGTSVENGVLYKTESTGAHEEMGNNTEKPIIKQPVQPIQTYVEPLQKTPSIKSIAEIQADVARNTILGKLSRDPAYADLLKESPDAAIKAYNIANAQGLEEQLNALRPETEEQREKREKRERTQRNIVAIADMVGSLGNFVNAVGSRDGRSVPQVSLSGSLNTAIDKGKAERAKNLDKFNELQGKRSSIIENGYKDVKERKALELAAAQRDFENKLKIAKAKGDDALNNAKINKYLAEAAKLLNEGNIEGYKEAKAKLENEVLKQRLSNLKQTYSRNAESDIVRITYENGGKEYVLPKEKWNTVNKAEAWKKIDADLRAAYVNELLDFVKKEGNSTSSVVDPKLKEVMELLKELNTMKRPDAYERVMQNDKLLEMVIGLAVDDPDNKNEALHSYLRNLSGSKKEDEPKAEDKQPEVQTETNNAPVKKHRENPYD